MITVMLKKHSLLSRSAWMAVLFQLLQVVASTSAPPHFNPRITTVGFLVPFLRLRNAVASFMIFPNSTWHLRGEVCSHTCDTSSRTGRRGRRILWSVCGTVTGVAGRRVTRAFSTAVTTPPRPTSSPRQPTPRVSRSSAPCQQCSAAQASAPCRRAPGGKSGFPLARTCATDQPRSTAASCLWTCGARAAARTRTARTPPLDPANPSPPRSAISS